MSRTKPIARKRSVCPKRLPSPRAAEAAAHAAEIGTRLWRRGEPIGAYDILIAGQARSRGLVVVTGNPGGFTRVDGLRSEHWPADANGI